MRLAAPVCELARAALARLLPDFQPTPFARVVAGQLAAAGLAPGVPKPA